MFGFSDDMNDVFNTFFAGGHEGFASGRRTRGEKKAVRALPVTLADLYNGKTVVLSRPRILPCPVCDGRGSKRKRSAACHGCRGSGYRDIVHQMGMMMQRATVPCDACGGSGTKIDPKDLCNACGGSRTVQTESDLTVNIEPGMLHQEEIHFPSEGNFNPETGRFGDMVIVLEEMKDELFVREGDDLVMNRKITLAESLCGFQFVVKHLDNRELIVRRERGEITKPGEVKVVLHEGMPVHDNPTLRGDLIIKFEVIFPENVNPAQIDLLRSSLPPPKSVDMQNFHDAEVCYVSEMDLDTLRKSLEAEVEDEEEGPTSVGCVPQ